MKHKWPLTPLSEVLTERNEVPLQDDLLSGRIRIIEKIRFNTGQIQLRVNGATKTGMIMVRPGDLVVSGINAAKGAIAIYDETATEPVAATIHYGAYIPKQYRVNVRFLWWMLRSRFFQELLLEYVPGGIKTELKAKRLLPVPVPLPLLAEQKKVVAQIEELDTKISEARSLRQEATREAEALLGSAASALLGVLPTDGILSDILLEKPRNGWSARCDNTESGVPVLTLSAVTGFHYDSIAFKRTSEPTNQDAHYWLDAGDLLITRSNTPDLVGHSAIYNGNPSPCIYPDLMMKLKINREVADVKFVWRWLQTSTARDYIGRHSKGTSPTMKKISQGVVMSIPFPVGIPLARQHSIVTYLDDLQAKVDTLKRLQNETTAELNAMLPAILDLAFKGEL